jgi:hypothetical protein
MAKAGGGSPGLFYSGTGGARRLLVAEAGPRCSDWPTPLFPFILIGGRAVLGIPENTMR